MKNTCTIYEVPYYVIVSILLLPFPSYLQVSPQYPEYILVWSGLGQMQSGKRVPRFV